MDYVRKKLENTEAPAEIISTSRHIFLFVKWRCTGNHTIQEIKKNLNQSQKFSILQLYML